MSGVGEREIEGHQALTIGNDELRAAFVPGAGMLGASILHRGEEILGQRNGVNAYVERKSTMGIPLLYPWANRLSGERFPLEGTEIDLSGKSPRLKRDGNGLPMHGLMSAAAGWRVERHEPLAGGDGGGLLEASFDWSAHEDLMTLFPFPHELRLTASVEGAALTVTTRARATAELPVPIAFGFHPYLTLPGVDRRDWLVELPVSEQLDLDGRGLPAGERRPIEIPTAPLGDRTYDDLFLAPAGGAPFALSGGGRRIELTMDEAFPYSQIYAPEGQALIAIEPMTTATDALITGDSLTHAAPGQDFVASFTITVAADAE